MKDLDKKFREDTLSEEELLRLRKWVNEASDEEIGTLMEETWMEECAEGVSLPDTERMSELKRRIDNERRSMLPEYRPAVGFRLKQFLSVAAAILLPVFIVTTYIFYQKSRVVGEQAMAVATGKGERATVILPDGTSVFLNSGSRISYVPADFDKKERRVKMEGEGYFRVSRNEDCPFLVDAKGLQVKVLGTTFNLCAYEEDKTAGLALEEGRVEFSSLKTGKSVVLNRGEKAILSLEDGRITVRKDADICDASAWQRGDLIFRSATLEEVIRKMERNYGVHIATDFKRKDKDCFTGTLTSSDLDEALKVLEMTYHFSVEKKGDEIRLSVK